MYNQRDIVEVNFLFPDGTFKPHPALIVSNDELQEEEGFIYLCLISSKNYKPQYCYELDNDMMTKPLAKKSYVKCQILTANVERDVIKKIGRLKKHTLTKLSKKLSPQFFK
ncbi:MAG: type II toxin-antitoxin system PemK/MazF family toxin [Paludibacteraceae bacterium]|nr:type II toxin-antitoxin system PemK/MazF family toxin [Paludibacteraceae bacterium]